jgi:hypothetical protein
MLKKSKGRIIYILNFIRLKRRINILELNLNARKNYIFKRKRRPLIRY